MSSVPQSLVEPEVAAVIMPRRSVTRALISLLLALGISACASGQSENLMRAAGEGEDVRLTVRNNDFRDATIYAYWDGARERVGMVTGKTNETFRMRWRGNRIQLEVDFIGGGGYRSDVLDVYRGDHLDFFILPRS